MLTAKNISYYVDKSTPLFRNLEFSINKGEIIGLMGRSGAGKTTFAKILAGYDVPDEGEVSIKQKKGEPHPVQLIWQHPEQAVNPKWRIEKVLREAGEPDSEIVELFGIEKEWLKRFPLQLSGGELQRVCIARCLLTNPNYIIADEMTTMLDPISQAAIWKAFIKIAKQRKIGLLVISHDRHLLERLCGKILTFDQISQLK
ncbi:peptide/nickel transport system ATP-binding protein [Gracilibacillus ureilyticus]|uniref:Peptide/nickel transport system ATP-binding protein n=1 Tax=Gracilibacillus ureilyticus TaxID=531814 RepID=A0A1H9PIQ7_9BACI|nr:ATP-binding cassette domain-containing protein [Gracilibacillus ureilyticus]SER48034.1 peptide/nickel transport system ATP-binding protein [Gracilibacillus ureilyticus]